MLNLITPTVDKINKLQNITPLVKHNIVGTNSVVMLNNIAQFVSVIFACTI